MKKNTVSKLAVSLLFTLGETFVPKPISFNLKPLIKSTKKLKNNIKKSSVFTNRKIVNKTPRFYSLTEKNH